MVLDRISKLTVDNDPVPNKFTVFMGERVREARLEAKLSQKELGDSIHRKQTTISDIENGKIEISYLVLALLSATLKKPITYFYPPSLYQELEPEKFSPLELELLEHFNNIWSEHLQEVAVDVIRVFAEFNAHDMVIDSIERVIATEERNEEIRHLIESRNKRKRV